METNTGVVIILEISTPIRSRLILEASAARIAGLEAAASISGWTRKLNLLTL